MSQLEPITLYRKALPNKTSLFFETFTTFKKMYLKDLRHQRKKKVLMFLSKTMKTNINFFLSFATVLFRMCFFINV